MGLLKSLQKIAKKTDLIGGGKLVDPAGTLTGAYDKKGAPAAAAPAAGMAVTDPTQYGGDTTDPAYGSFATPFTGEDYLNYADPGYEFQLQQGNQALLNSAGVGGSALGGAALKDLLKYNQDYAGTAYQGAFDRYQTTQNNIFSRLFNLTQLGQNAAAGVGSQGTALAGQAGNAYQNAGSATGAGIVGAGNAISGGLNDYFLYSKFANSNPTGYGGGMPLAGSSGFNSAGLA